MVLGEEKKLRVTALHSHTRKGIGKSRAGEVIYNRFPFLGGLQSDTGTHRSTDELWR